MAPWASKDTQSLSTWKPNHMHATSERPFIEEIIVCSVHKLEVQACGQRAERQGSFSWPLSCQWLCPTPSPSELAFTLPPVGSCPVCLLQTAPGLLPVHDPLLVPTSNPSLQCG
jgi:hypothetical protein